MKGVDGSVADRFIDEQLPGSLAAAAEARQRLEPLRAFISVERFEEVRLLVNELVTNALRHAGAITTGGIGLRVQIDGPTVRIEVTDHGPGFEPKVETPTLEQTSGRGLFLVETLADDWGVIDGDGTTVWASLPAR